MEKMPSNEARSTCCCRDNSIERFRKRSHHFFINVHIRNQDASSYLVNHYSNEFFSNYCSISLLQSKKIKLFISPYQVCPLKKKGKKQKKNKKPKCFRKNKKNCRNDEESLDLVSADLKRSPVKRPC